jgi:phosphomannomutase / phosphoglucomutase
VEKVTQSFAKTEYEIITVDGVRVQTDDGWGLLRASNTGPKLILRFEGKTPGKLDEMKDLFRGVLDAIPELKGVI